MHDTPQPRKCFACPTRGVNQNWVIGWSACAVCLQGSETAEHEAVLDWSEDSQDQKHRQLEDVLKAVSGTGGGRVGPYSGASGLYAIFNTA
jgi:hypothetical protein